MGIIHCLQRVETDCYQVTLSVESSPSHSVIACLKAELQGIKTTLLPVPRFIASGAPHPEMAYFFKEVSLFSFQAEKTKQGTQKRNFTLEFLVRYIKAIFLVASKCKSKIIGS